MIEADLVKTAPRECAQPKSEGTPQVASKARDNIIALPGQLFTKSSRGLQSAGTFRTWRASPTSAYADVAGFSKSANLPEIISHGHILTSGRYVGAEDIEDDGEAFDEKMPRLATKLASQFAESSKLEVAIKANLKGLGDAF